MLIVCTCRRCRRTVNYLASDLEMFGELRLVGEIWGRCPKCGSEQHWSETARYPLSADVGHTMIRRPAGFRQVRQWRDEWYEPPAVPPPAQQSASPPGPMHVIVVSSSVGWTRGVWRAQGTAAARFRSR